MFEVPNVEDFHWSPTDNIISYFVPESPPNKPAQVVLLEIPTFKEVAKKNLFKVLSSEMRWHPQGNFLVVRVDRYKSSKKQTTETNFEFFRLREKLVPIDSTVIAEDIIAYALEPKGTRFAVIHGDNLRPSVSFYQLGNGKVELIKKLEKKTANKLYWSPEGTNILLAGLGNFNGVLEFFNCDEMETIANEEHYQCTDITWDPTGRFVCTYISHWLYPSENGYNIYNLHGQLKRHILQDRFFQFVWRPRPQSLLPKSKLDNIKKNIDSYAQKFKEEDQKIENEKLLKKKQKRDAQRDEFKKYMEKHRSTYHVQEHDERQRLLANENDDLNWTFIEVMDSEVLSEKEEIVA